MISPLQIYTILFVNISLLSSGVVGDQTPDSPLPKISKSQNEKVQLGVSLTKLSDVLYAQLPGVPRGCGFVLKTVDSDSSVGKVGLKPMDVIWKIDDQLLINESQLSVLLSLYKVGDEVELHYFQSGESKQVSMKLFAKGSRDTEAVKLPFPMMPHLPMHVVSYEDKSASINDQNGSITLKFNQGKPWLLIESLDGDEIFNAEISSAESLALVPQKWRAKVPMLQHSIKNSASLRKLPRVRRVTKPKPELVNRSGE